MDGLCFFVSSLALWRLTRATHAPPPSIKINPPPPPSLSPSPSTSTPPSPPLRVVIIGSGLGGLSLAIALEKEGIFFEIFERDEKLEDRREGFGLTLTCGKNGALDKLGVLEVCLNEDCPSFCHWIFTPEGKILGYFGRALKNGLVERHAGKRSGNIRIPREVLRRMLIENLTTKIQWNKKFIGCSFNKTNPEDGIRVHFSDGTFTQADVLVGADGLNSRVRCWRDANLFNNSLYDLNDFSESNFRNIESQTLTKKRFLGVTAILGISKAIHPLISKQGFYILDGKTRIFTMPYSVHPDGSPKCCMWQLSFSGLTEGEALLLKNAGPRAQLEEAFNRTQGWMSPVQELIEQTDLEDIWATPLYDRMPMTLRRSKATNGNQNQFPSSRITVIGDACHPMSMFKGQGANQALLDGPLLTSWLSKGGRQKSLTLCQRIQNFEREMVARSSPKVQASHEASDFLHSPAVLEEVYTIEGVDADTSSRILKQFEIEGIDSSRGEELERLMTEIYSQIKESNS